MKGENDATSSENRRVRAYLHECSTDWRSCNFCVVFSVVGACSHARIASYLSVQCRSTRMATNFQKRNKFFCVRPRDAHCFLLACRITFSFGDWATLPLRITRFPNFDRTVPCFHLFCQLVLPLFLISIASSFLAMFFLARK